MSVAATSRSAERVRTRPAAARAAAAATALVTLALLALTWRGWGDLGSDTGYDLLAGWHVSHGRFPYVDFVYYYGPLSPFLLGAAGLLDGGALAIGPAVAVGVAVALLVVAATYALACRLLPPLGAFLASAITAGIAFVPGNYSYVLPHTDAATLGTLLLLGALLGVFGHARSGGRGRLLVLGLLVGLTALTKPEPTAAGWFAVAVWLAVRARHGAHVRREALTFAAPALAVPLLVYGAFLGAVPLHRLVFDNLYPAGVLRGSPIVRSRLPLTFSSFAEQGARLALYAAAAAALVGVGSLLARRAGGRLTPVACALAAVVLVAAFTLRPEAVRHGLELAWGWVPAGALVALVLVVRRAWRRGSRWTAVEQAELAGLAVLAALAATTYPNFFPDAPNEQTAVYFMPFAAIFLVRLHLVVLARTRPAYLLGAVWVAFLALASVGLTVRDMRAQSATVRGPGGALAAAPLEARLYDGALLEIDRTLAPGEPMLVAPFMADLYALSGHPTPLPQLVVVPGAFPDAAAQRRAIAELDRAHVRLVVTDDSRKPEYGERAFGVSYDRLLAAWIRSHFRLAARFHVPAHTVIPQGRMPARTVFVWVRSA